MKHDIPIHKNEIPQKHLRNSPCPVIYIPDLKSMLKNVDKMGFGCRRYGPSGAI